MCIPVIDWAPGDNVRLCINCEYKDNIEKCPLIMKEPKVISGRGYARPYTVAWAREDIRYDHSCYIHRYAAQKGDKKVCKRVKQFASKPYASCEACSKEYGLEGCPCSD